jgi:hypothetical protein
MSAENNQFQAALNAMLDFKKIFTLDTKNLGAGQIEMDSDNRQKAEAALLQISHSGQESARFAQLPLADFVEAMRNRLKDPDGVNQSHLNVCGAATFLRFWLIQDPENFVKIAFELYLNGCAKYKNVELVAHEEMYQQATHLNKIDWLVAASLQNAGGFLGYNPESEMGGVRGIALPSQVAHWLGALPRMTLEQVSTMPSIDTINQVFSKNGAVALLVNINLLDDHFTNPAYRNTENNFKDKLTSFFGSIAGNHYIALNSVISREGDNFRFHVWTWGTSLEVLIPVDKIAAAINQFYLLRAGVIA